MTQRNIIICSLVFVALLFGMVLGYFIGSQSRPNNENIVINNVPAGNYSLITSGEGVKIDLTAKEALDIAFVDASNWSKDSRLSEIDLVSKKFDMNGRSKGWKVIFYSKTKNKLYEVLIRDGESRGGEEKTAPKVLQTLKGDIVDSPILANNFFGSNPIDTDIISLKMYYDGGSKKFIWTVFFPKGSYTINAEL